MWVDIYNMKNNNNQTFIKNTVFIFGSPRDEILPKDFTDCLDNIIQQKISIFVDDNDDVGCLTQDYCYAKNYFNVTIFSAEIEPKYLATEEFKINTFYQENLPKITLHRNKHLALINHSRYGLFIWNGKTVKVYNQILNAIKNKTLIKVYFLNENERYFLPKERINEKEIEALYRNHNGYSMTEVLEILGIKKFKNAMALNKYLSSKNIIRKDEEMKCYVPMPGYEDLFICDTGYGKPSNPRGNVNFIAFLKRTLKDDEENLVSSEMLFSSDSSLSSQNECLEPLTVFLDIP